MKAAWISMAAVALLCLGTLVKAVSISSGDTRGGIGQFQMACMGNYNKTCVIIDTRTAEVVKVFVP